MGLVHADGELDAVGGGAGAVVCRFAERFTDCHFDLPMRNCEVSMDDYPSSPPAASADRHGPVRYPKIRAP